MHLIERAKHPPRWVFVLGVYALMLAVTFLAFGEALGHGFAPVDDWFLITQNLAVQGISFENIKHVFTSYDPELYIPLVFLTFQLNYLMGGLDPVGFHLLNLLLHAGNAMLVTWLLVLLTKNRPLAVLGALIFAVHPLHTEAVVWVAGRKDLLSTFFSLLTVIQYLRYREGNRSAYILSVLFLLLALLSKATAMAIPAVLILSDLCLERRRIDRRFFLDKVPFIILAAIFIVVALGGKERVIGDSSLVETILIAAKSTTFYLQKLFFPAGLTITYMQNDPVSILTPDLLIRVVITLLILLASGWALWKKPWLAFGVLFYLATLAPTYLNARKGGTVFFAVDRYAYLPSIGILILLTTLATGLSGRNHRRIALGISIVSILMIILSRMQTKTWETPEALYTHAHQVYPETVLTYVDLAELNRKKRRYQEAAAYIQEGLRYGDSIFLHLSAGRLYANTGNIAGAITEFEKARAMDLRNPEPLFSLGSLEEQHGDKAKAEQYYRQAADLDSSYVAAYVKLGEFALERGELDRAEEHFTHALSWNPNADIANLGMAKLLRSRDEIDRAEEHFQKVLALDPYHMEVLLALAEIALEDGRKDEARGYAERILKQDQKHLGAMKIMEME
ncbi:tetratricopeptide repeat protein [Candidatus Peregrinibacteria bacterium]|nr:tetratricopeptide repeat protein [Candidatus Peregrinibacteria bacterium]